MLSWIYLIIAGMLEVVWALALKSSDGFSRPWPSALVVVAGFFSIILLSFAVRNLGIGISYAVWTGIGTLGTVLIGSVFYHETIHLSQIVFLGFILVGVVGLKLCQV